GLAASKCAAAASKSAPVPAVLRTFASRLGVSPSAAGRVLKQLAALNAKVGGVDPTGSAFAAIADGLEVSPARLAAAWNAVLHSVAGN
ncbi:MAG TPA: hypothetical protein VE441_12295, partial [Mycobacterium sp.]|nr:hypothetical protein [Mycobacterium sp.]